MSDPHPFPPAKLVVGLIYADPAWLGRAAAALVERFGPVEARSPEFAFDTTDYYASEMGTGLKRVFLAFERPVDPSGLAGIKLETNGLEEALRSEAGTSGRVVNIDPGTLTPSALIMATGKDFSHRVPLRDGVFAHLEMLFTKTGTRALDWTYPDMRKPGVGAWLIELRRKMLERLKTQPGPGRT